MCNSFHLSIQRNNKKHNSNKETVNIAKNMFKTFNE